MTTVISARSLSKTFVLHTQGGARIPVFRNVSLDVTSGECVCLHGPSGAGKSTLLRSLYANYKPDTGEILVNHRGRMVDIVSAAPREVIELRRATIGYVSQFLRVIPRVSTLDVVAEPAIALGVGVAEAREHARLLLDRLAIPERLWALPPATFSGGEQQRVNIARGFVNHYPVMLLDEPTASLDATNRRTVVEIISEAKARGTAVVGIFHDAEVRDAVADRLFDVVPISTRDAWSIAPSEAG
ncbi:phosphonate C-P lyase system protein PhnL [Burkholderia contaminans]|uniref:Phosphonate C-P lyase system protein PhnL n=1 Tax=Burkholderia contaminans TaxID=488447 RepID=A0A3N8R5W5_9BURK|nr:phosphonate C-P lyase system protein PhnL [Burkholderia contaminans]RQT14959.1 phosphonate C-P lyase system protein PhnL [Burkholderia contaminans]